MLGKGEKMDKNYIFDNGLGLKAKGLLTILLNLPKDFKITQDNLMTLAKDGRTNIKKTLTELTDKGYLLIEQSHSNKGFVYTYTAEPIPKFLP